MPLTAPSSTNKYYEIYRILLWAFLLLLTCNSFAQIDEVSDLNFQPPEKPPEIMNTDQSKKWSLGVECNFGNFYNGKRTTTSISGRLAPIPNAAITVDYENINFQKVGIEELDLSIHLITLGSRFAINPRLQLSAFYQYNSFDTQGRWNVRASWEYQPLSFVYVVFNNTQIDELTESFNERQVVSKITLVKQF